MNSIVIQENQATESEVNGSDQEVCQKIDDKISRKAIFFAFSFCTDAFIFDRLTKWLVMHDELAVREIVPRFFAITKHHNFGLLGDTVVPVYVMYGLNAVAFVILIQTIIEHVKRNESLKLVALMVVMGGALGNLYDRVVFGYVFDWLLFFNTSIINLADVFITVGLIFYAWLVIRKKERL